MSKYKDYLLEQEAQGQDVFVEYPDEPDIGTELDLYGDNALDADF